MSMSPAPKHPQSRPAHPVRPAATKPQQTDQTTERQPATSKDEPPKAPQAGHRQETTPKVVQAKEQKVVEHDADLDEGARHAPPQMVEHAESAQAAKIEFDGSSELQYWWTPVSAADALQAEKDSQPAMARNAVANLITLNPDYVPDD